MSLQFESSGASVGAISVEAEDQELDGDAGARGGVLLPLPPTSGVSGLSTITPEKSARAISDAIA